MSPPNKKQQLWPALHGIQTNVEIVSDALENDSGEWTITENTKLPAQFINEREELYV